VNAAVRLLVLAFSTMAVSLSANVASAFQLGDIKFHNSAKRFEFRIPVHELERDASSKLTGTVYSQNDVVDLLSYGIESAGVRSPDAAMNTTVSAKTLPARTRPHSA